MRSRISVSAFPLRRSASTGGATSSPSSTIQRHGPGDGVVTLNVGGKNFQTLRSTIAQNDVLMDHVVRAEANMERSSDHAIFIDRDPKHFGMILAYLRNKVDGIYYGQHRLLKFGSTNTSRKNGICQTTTNAKKVTAQIISKSLRSSASFVQLPNDTKTLNEMYLESLHYNIPDLTDRICSQQSLARIFGIFGSTNPFQMATNVLATGKRMLILFGGVLTGMGGWVYAQAMSAQAKTSKFLENSECDMVNQDGFWDKQTDFWKIAAKNLSVSAEGK